MKDSTTAWILILIFTAVAIFGFYTIKLAERNFDNIPDSYPEIYLDAT